MEQMSDRDLEAYIENLRKNRDKAKADFSQKGSPGTPMTDEQIDMTLDRMNPESLRKTIELFKKDAMEARKAAVQNKEAL